MRATPAQIHVHAPTASARGKHGDEDDETVADQRHDHGTLVGRINQRLTLCFWFGRLFWCHRGGYQRFVIDDESDRGTDLEK